MTAVNTAARPPAYGSALPDDAATLQTLMRIALSWQDAGRTTVPGFPSVRTSALIASLSAALEVSLDRLREVEYEDGAVAVDGRVLSDSSQSDQLDAVELRNSLLPYLEFLGERERQILQLRYGLVDGVCYEQEDVADLFCVGRERISRLESAALLRLRTFMQADGW